MLTVPTILFSIFCCFYFDNENLFNLKIQSIPLFHAIISGVGSNLLFVYNPNILYNPYNIFEYNNNFIYYILPIISFGYSFYDLYIGIKSNKLENIFHGIFFLLLMSSFYYFDALSVLNIPLLGETSSIFLNLRPLRNNIIDYLFVITFTFYRMIYVPILSIMYIYNSPCINIIGSTCNKEVIGSIFLVLFYILNSYWFYYIYKKIMRHKNKVIVV